MLVLPLVGATSPARAQQIVDALLAGISRHAARTAILDLTGLTDPDSTLPAHLQRIAACTRLVGARLVLAGVSPDVARSIVAEVGDLHDVKVHSTLAAALTAASRVRPTPR